MVGFLVGPIIGCGLIANLYFKDTWGRARPVHIEELEIKFLQEHLKNRQNVKGIAQG